MNTTLFFAVWDLPELQSIIRSFMWPGRRSATWYDYKDVQAACRWGYYDLVVKLYRTSTDCGRWLHVATTYGHLNIVKFLRLSVQANHKITAMGLAVEHNHMHIVQYLESTGTRITALYLAARSGSVEMYKYMNAKYTGKKEIAEDVIYSGNLEFVKWYELTYGALDATTGLLAAAASRANLDIFKWLMGERGVRLTDDVIRALATDLDTVPILDYIVSSGVDLREYRGIIAVSHARLVRWFYRQYPEELCVDDLISLMPRFGKHSELDELYSRSDIDMHEVLIEIAESYECCHLKHLLDLRDCVLPAEMFSIAAEVSDFEMMEFLLYARPEKFVVRTIETILAAEKLELLKDACNKYDIEIKPSDVTCAVKCESIEILAWVCDKYEGRPEDLILTQIIGPYFLPVNTIQYLYERYGTKLSPVGIDTISHHLWEVVNWIEWLLDTNLLRVDPGWLNGPEIQHIPEHLLSRIKELAGL